MQPVVLIHGDAQVRHFSRVRPSAFRSLCEGACLPGTDVQHFISERWDLTRRDEELEGMRCRIVRQHLRRQHVILRVQHRNALGGGSGICTLTVTSAGTLPCQRIEDQYGNSRCDAGIDIRDTSVFIAVAEISFVAQRTWS